MENNPLSVEVPSPKDFVSMMQDFSEDKMLKLNIDELKKDHRLVPFGGDFYGVYPEKGRELFDRVGKLNTNYEGDRSEYEGTPPIMVIKFNKDVYIIAQSAFAHDGYRELTIEAGCNNYIEKPIKRQKLLELITKSGLKN